MKNIFFATLLLILSACVPDSISLEGLSQNQQKTEDIDISDGVYLVSCFKNKFATEGIGIPIYSKSIMTLNNRGSGRTNYELYSDATCTTLVNAGTVSIVSYETVLVDGERVLKMTQDDGSGQMDIWIGYKLVGSSYYFDTDYSDGESGPYAVEPLVIEMMEFMNDPVRQGIKLIKQ